MKITKQTLLKILYKELDNTPQFSFFGDDNHDKIRAGIDAIERDYSIDDIYDLNLDFDTEDHIISYLNVLSGEYQLEDVIYGDISQYEDILNDHTDINMCKSLCGECPFSKNSMKGFLGDYEIEDFLKFQNAEILFPCHKTLSEEDLTIEEAELKIINNEIKLCRGFIESMVKSGKSPRNSYLKSATEIVKNNLSDNSMSIIEFFKNHKITTYNNES